eukprot:CAMPEP_0119265468 /NCGR_PEP_ID=MMETSP1329-20130426/4276_1 /TAXON_ID=114041 /ORGANISM="Genus nov. species nov., Strain RCC1024" /LENGTH=309 /DNA_ID=CAMNT_0007265297 /DNA_START=191 /DNA_END=1119 /DNA_ORIENTATION=-
MSSAYNSARTSTEPTVTPRQPASSATIPSTKVAYNPIAETPKKLSHSPLQRAPAQPNATASAAPWPLYTLSLTDSASDACNPKRSLRDTANDSDAKNRRGHAALTTQDDPPDGRGRAGRRRRTTVQASGDDSDGDDTPGVTGSIQRCDGNNGGNVGNEGNVGNGGNGANQHDASEQARREQRGHTPSRRHRPETPEPANSGARRPQAKVKPEEAPPADLERRGQHAARRELRLQQHEQTRGAGEPRGGLLELVLPLLQLEPTRLDRSDQRPAAPRRVHLANDSRPRTLESSPDKQAAALNAVAKSRNYR